MLRVREVCASPSGNAFAIAEVEELVAVGRVQDASVGDPFRTGFSAGGGRLAIDDPGERVFIGSYHDSTVTCYSSKGEPIWRRDSLRNPQFLSVSADCCLLFCGQVGRDLVVLDTESGELVDTMKGVIRVFPSPAPNLVLAETKSAMRLVDLVSTSCQEQEKKSFSILSVAFGAGQVLVSETNSCIRSFSEAGFEYRWMFDPPSGSHALDVSYISDVSSFVAALWSYSDGGPCALVNLRDDGASEIGILNTVVFAFLPSESAYLMNDGQKIDALTGVARGSVAFDP